MESDQETYYYQPATPSTLSLFMIRNSAGKRLRSHHIPPSSKFQVPRIRHPRMYVCMYTCLHSLHIHTILRFPGSSWTWGKLLHTLMIKLELLFQAPCHARLPPLFSLPAASVIFPRLHMSSKYPSPHLSDFFSPQEREKENKGRTHRPRVSESPGYLRKPHPSQRARPGD